MKDNKSTKKKIANEPNENEHTILQSLEIKSKEPPKKGVDTETKKEDK